MRNPVASIVLILFAGIIYQPEKRVTETGNKNRFVPISCQLRTGDIILRRGKGFISELFRKTSRHYQQYSHAGIIRQTPHGTFVMHVIGDSGSNSSRVKSEPLADFCNSSANYSFAVYRYPFLSGKENSVIAYLEEMEQRRIKFDDQFDLNSDDAMYCTELIYKMCLVTAGMKLPLSTLKGEEYVGLDDLYRDYPGSLIFKRNY